MKVLLMGPLPQHETSGGVERHFTGLITALDAYTDLDVEVLTVSKSPIIDNGLFSKNIKLHTIKSPPIPWTVSGFSIDLLKVLKAVNSIKPDLIHAQMLEVPYGLAAALLSSDYPTVITVHSLPHKDYLFKNSSWKTILHDPLFKKMAEYQIKKARKLVVVSEHLRNLLASYCSKEKIIVIPNGIDEFFFGVRNPKDNYFLFVGRIMPVKGIDFLLDSLALVKKRAIKFSLKIVGPVVDKAYFSSLKKQIHDLNLKEEVEFLPPANDKKLKELYEHCGVLILPSRSESLPMVVMEAMAMGVPIAATRVGDLPRLIENGKNGVLVDFGNTKEMAERLAELISNGYNLTEMGKNAGQTAQAYRWATIAEKTAKLYNDLKAATF
jgi:glycosyltransferase involved in cell wall biosynthesis